MVVTYTQSLATIQKDGATEVDEAFSSWFGHLHESFLDSSVVGHGNDFLIKVGPIMKRGRGEEKFEICVCTHT